MQKEPLVFLPGMMCDIRLFSHQLVDLAGERTLTVAPITDGETITEIAKSVLSDAPRKFALAGLSMAVSLRGSCVWPQIVNTAGVNGHQSLLRRHMLPPIVSRKSSRQKQGNSVRSCKMNLSRIISRQAQSVGRSRSGDGYGAEIGTICFYSSIPGFAKAV